MKMQGHFIYSNTIWW